MFFPFSDVNIEGASGTPDTVRLAESHALCLPQQSCDNIFFRSKSLLYVGTQGTDGTEKSHTVDVPSCTALSSRAEEGIYLISKKR
jgi:hypothetical protein